MYDSVLLLKIWLNPKYNLFTNMSFLFISSHSSVPLLTNNPRYLLLLFDSPNMHLVFWFTFICKLMAKIISYFVLLRNLWKIVAQLCKLTYLTLCSIVILTNGHTKASSCRKPLVHWKVSEKSFWTGSINFVFSIDMLLV